MLFKGIILTTLILVLLAPNIYAQTSTPKARLNVKIKENQLKNIDERKEKVATKISAVRKERIRKYSVHMITRIEALVERLNTLADRLETRIAKIKTDDSNLNTTQAEADLAEAKLKLSEAKTKLEIIKSDLETTLVADDPKVIYEKVKTSLSELKTILKEAHQLMVHSIGELKGLRIGVTKEDGK